ncbi:hypothetical protein F7725_021819 [Dissostichus mawsoni]|uniref:Splicing factor 45 n=1 Tax=Dissostichus mawsoni TaxID=36200 RepID=A0A7J5ZCY3_DISMA|nr:hypothetical protein F7725_021819 [Dissostichus mawsoni]
MSLYDDLGVGASDTKTEGWSKNFKLLQSQLKRGGSIDERQIIDTPPHAAAGLKDTVPSGFSSSDALIPLADEYDPMFPNDYEKVVKRHREERQRQREQERQKEIDDREKKRKDRHEGGAPSGFSRFPAAEGESDEEEDYEAERRKRTLGGAAIAPPSSLVDKDGSYCYEEEVRPPRGSKAAIPPRCMKTQSERAHHPDPPAPSSLTWGTVAHKIMQKYGFKEGQGLGKHEQGLSTALSVEKTSKRGGKIIIGDAAEKRDNVKKSDANPLTEILKNPTKVVLLRNMVGRGEVDEDLEGETKEECEKYGKVIAVVPDEDAVRIFLEFERVESAIKAVVDLNGRYFGGRIVRACFYNLDKFRVLDLGEQV